MRNHLTAVAAICALGGAACGGSPFAGESGDGGGSDATLEGSSLSDGPIVSPGPDGMSADAGCAAVLMNDPMNCGACGHACLGSMCASGLCSPVTLDQSLSNPAGIALAGATLYVAVDRNCTATPPDCPYGEIHAIPTDPDAGVPIVIAAMQDTPGRVAVDATTLYWTTASPSLGYVMEMSLANPTGPKTFASALTPPPLALAVSSGMVFWASRGGNLTRQGKGSNAATVLYDDSNGGDPNDIAVDDAGQTLYWAIEHDSTMPNDVSADGVVQSFQVENNQPPAVTLGSGLSGPLGVASDGKFVVWTTFLGDGGLWLYQANGGGTLLATQAHTVKVAIRGAYAYATSTGSLDSGLKHDGTLFRVPLAGGPGLVLATGLTNPGELVLDDSYVYWVNRGTINGGDGSVLRVAR